MSIFQTRTIGRFTMLWCIVPAAMLVLAIQLGCGDGQETRLPVSGIVTLDGKPLADAKVTLIPKDGRRAANGLTGESGRFESATTFSQGDGAVIGEHYVAITPKEPPPMPGDEISSPGSPGPGTPAKYVAPIPERYGSPKQSGLEVSVTRGSSNDFSFELESR